MGLNSLESEGADRGTFKTSQRSAPDKIISLYPTQPRQRAQLKLAA